MAGNMVPVDYFEGLLRAVVVHLEEAGADFTVQGKHSAYCTLLLEEYHNTKLNAMLGWEAATNALVNIPGNAPTNASANASASAPANAPTNTSGNTPTKVQRAGAHPLVALVANKQDPTGSRILCTGQHRSIGGIGGSASIPTINGSREGQDWSRGSADS